MAGLYDILYGSADAARAEAAAREAAISGDASRARLATLMWGSPDRLGGQLAQMAQHDEGELSSALKDRGMVGAEGLYSKLLLGKQKGDYAEARAQERAQALALVQQLKNEGLLAGIGAKGDVAERLARITGADKKEIATIMAAPRAFSNPVVRDDGSVVVDDRRNGAVTITPPTPNPTDPTAPSLGSKLRPSPDDKSWQQFVYKTTPQLQSIRTGIGQNANTLNAVSRSLTLVGAHPDKTPQEVREIYQSLGRVINAGNQAARRSIDEIGYKTLNMTAADALQYFTNHPEDARAQDFVARTVANLQAENQNAHQNIKDAVGTTAAGMRDLVERKGSQARDYLKKFGFNDAEIDQQILGKPPAAAAAPAAPGAPSDADVEAFLKSRRK